MRHDHVDINVADLARAEAWYSAAFGLKREFATRIDAVDLDIVMLRNPDLRQAAPRRVPQGFSAGDILTTGTISGVAAVQLDPFEFYLRPGDVVEAEIEHVGVLRNRVVSWEEGHGTPVPTGDSLYSD